MFAIRSGLRASRLSGVRAFHSSTIVSAAPEAKISTAERIFSFFCIAGALFVSPMYCVPNFKNFAAGK